MLENIYIVLVNPSHPGNIGATARAMKTMGLSNLILVEPKLFPHKTATARAAGANDVLMAARVVDSLAAAIKDCHLVIGTSARLRELSLPLLNTKECANTIVTSADQFNKIALVFGREDAGLTTEELHYCHYHVFISANPEYPVLNVAAAVQILCYEIRQSFLECNDHPFLPVLPSQVQYAPTKDVLLYYQHLEKVLMNVGFLNPRHPKRLMPRLKRMFQRIRLEDKETKLLRGILTAIERTLEFKK